MGYMAGIILDMNPMAPGLLSIFAVTKKDDFESSFKLYAQLWKYLFQVNYMKKI